MTGTMDPRKQECVSFYLYGAGYFARDQNTLGLVTGQKTPPHFCLSCPMARVCEDQHERRVRRLRPVEVEHFDRVMRAAMRRGVAPTMVARMLSNQPGGDPFAEVAVENFKLGHQDRGKESGTLVG